MSVYESVERDVDGLGPGAKDSALAATALALAAELDGHNSATSKSMCAKALVDVLRELRVVAPARREKDDLDDLAARRERRLAGRAASASSSSS